MGHNISHHTLNSTRNGPSYVSYHESKGLVNWSRNIHKFFAGFFTICDCATSCIDLYTPRRFYEEGVLGILYT